MGLCVCKKSITSCQSTTLHVFFLSFLSSSRIMLKLNNVFSGPKAANITGIQMQKSTNVQGTLDSGANEAMLSMLQCC